jgi:hypothetical protein
MTLQFFETLKKLGASPASKFVVPLELSRLLAGMIGSLGQSPADGSTTANARPVGQDRPEGDGGSLRRRRLRGSGPFGYCALR